MSRKPTEKPKLTRMTVPVTTDVKSYLDMVAEQEGVTVTRATQKMIARGIYVEGIMESGGKLIVEDADGNQVVLASEQLELRTRLLSGPRQKRAITPQERKATILGRIEELLNILKGEKI